MNIEKLIESLPVEIQGALRQFQEQTEANQAKLEELGDRVSEQEKYLNQAIPIMAELAGMDRDSPCGRVCTPPEMQKIVNLVARGVYAQAMRDTLAAIKGDTGPLEEALTEWWSSKAGTEMSDTCPAC